MKPRAGSGGPAVLDRRRQDSAAKLGPSRLPLRESQADHLRTTGFPSCSLLLVIFQTSYCVIFDMCRGIDDTFAYVVKHKHLRNPASPPSFFLCGFFASKRSLFIPGVKYRVLESLICRPVSCSAFSRKEGGPGSPGSAYWMMTSCSELPTK